MSNLHLEATKEWVEYSAEQNPDNDGRAMHAAALAQAEALLAIAHELHTANLLTHAREVNDFDMQLFPIIETRLGLRDTK